MSRDRTDWPRCLIWHSWLPSLSGNMIGSPRAVNPTDDMCNQLETRLGPYHSDMMDQSVMDDEFDAKDTAERIHFLPTSSAMVAEFKTPSLNLKSQVLGFLDNIGEPHGNVGLGVMWISSWMGNAL